MEDSLPPFIDGGPIEALLVAAATTGLPPFIDGGPIEAGQSHRGYHAGADLPPFIDGGPIEALPQTSLLGPPRSFRRSSTAAPLKHALEHRQQLCRQPSAVHRRRPH